MKCPRTRGGGGGDLRRYATKPPPPNHPTLSVGFDILSCQEDGWICVNLVLMLCGKLSSFIQNAGKEEGKKQL